MRKKKEILTAIEVGTSAIKVVMGTPQANDTIAVLGYQEVSSLGKVVKGEPVQIDALADLLSEALNHLESQTGERIQATFAAVTGNHIATLNVQGSVPITAPDRTISEDDVVTAAKNTRNFSLPIDRRSIHTIERTYLVDGHRRSSYPVGMIGNQLTADVHLVHGNFNAIQTLCALLNNVLGFPANDIAFSGIADFYGLALPREGRHGVLVVDLGAGVTEYALFYEEGCMHSGQVAVGCEHLANDLAIGLKLPIARGRELLKKHGAARRHAGSDAQLVQVETSIGHPPRQLSEAAIQTIMEARLQELFEIILTELRKAQVHTMLSDHVVLCGGGALIRDINELAQSVFTVPVVTGLPGNASGLDATLNSPRYVTPVGLLHLGHRLQQVDPGVQPPMEVMKRELLRAYSLVRSAIRL